MVKTQIHVHMKISFLISEKIHHYFFIQSYEKERTLY